MRRVFALDFTTPLKDPALLAPRKHFCQIERPGRRDARLGPTEIRDDAGAFKEALDFMPRAPLEKRLVGQAVNRRDQPCGTAPNRN